MTKLGRLVKGNKIQSLEEIFLYSIPIKEYQIVDHFLGGGGREGDEDGKLMTGIVKAQEKAPRAQWVLENPGSSFMWKLPQA